MLPFIRITDTFTGTNPITRHVMSLACTLKRMRANSHAPKHPATQPLHGSNTRARAPTPVPSYKLRVGGSYPDNVTVYRYNGYIRGTNPIVRHAMSLTCTLKRMLRIMLPFIATTTHCRYKSEMYAYMYHVSRLNIPTILCV